MLRDLIKEPDVNSNFILPKAQFAYEPSEAGEFSSDFLGFFLLMKGRKTRDAGESLKREGGVEIFSFLPSIIFSIFPPIISPTKIPHKAKHIKGFKSHIESRFHSIPTMIRTFPQAFFSDFFL